MMTTQQKQFIVAAYVREESPADIGNQLGLTRSAVKEYLRRAGLCRTQSVAASIAAKHGRKDKAINALCLTNKTTNRFNPRKLPWLGNSAAHPRWIKDRSKVKRKRMITEEKQFMCSMLRAHNYMCSLTGHVGGRLSVHHVFPVWKYPNRRFDRTAIVVVSLVIHKLFHARYGWKADEHAWYRFVAEGEFNDAIQDRCNASRSMGKTNATTQETQENSRGG